MTDHERLHQRLHDGTADPGMYPDCAREMGMFDDHAPDPSSDELCAIRGHEYLGDDGDRGRCYCGEKEYAAGGGALSSPDYDGKEDAMTDETGTTRPNPDDAADTDTARESGSDEVRTGVDEKPATSVDSDPA